MMKENGPAKSRSFWWTTGIVLSIFCGSANAQYQYVGTVNYKYSEKIDQSSNVSALGDDLFGDSTNYENGATTFSVVDVKAQSNVGIPVQMGRVLNIRGASGWSIYNQINQYPTEFNIFGDKWEADLPYIQNDSLADFGWVADNGGGRCTSGRFSKSATNVSQIVVPAHNFFYGNDINIPAYGKERLLAILSGGIVPGDGISYVGTTKSNWKISCIPSIKNGSGEGFVVTLPDGAKYYFDWLVFADTGYISTQRGNLNLRRFRLYATRATDRFGGSVEYSYDDTNPARISQIQSSDGVLISVAYNNTLGAVESISLGSRIWQYSYGTTMTVTLPDNSKWTYSSAPHGVDGKLGLNPCQITLGTRSSNVQPGPNEAQTLMITHPSGAIGSFSFRPIMFGYNKIPDICQPGASYRPKAYIGNALYAKSISGVGVPAKNWDVKYYPSWSYASECAGCPTTAATIVSENSNRSTTYVFGNDYSNNAGQLLSKTISGDGVSSSESYAYLTSAAGQPFPDAIGEDTYQHVSNPLVLKNRPVKMKVVTQNGRTFKYIIDTYDQFARPTKVTKSSVPSP